MHIPDDPSAPVIKAEFEAAKADMIHALRQLAYSRIEPNQFWIADAHNRTRLLCAAAAMVRTGRPNELATYLCVGGWNDKFIKFRTTGEQLPEAPVRRFPQAWMGLLWPP